MIDVARNRGIEIDEKKLSLLLGVPVVPIIARSGFGTVALMDAVESTSQAPPSHPLRVSYGRDLETAILKMEKMIVEHHFLTDFYPSRWIAIKYLENDTLILEKGRESDLALSDQLEVVTRTVGAHIEETLETYPEAMIADHRYGFISSMLKRGVIKERHDKNRLFLSDRIDKVLVNRFAGPIIMLLVLMGLYQFVFTYSEVPVGWCEVAFGWLADMVTKIMSDGLLKSLIVSGIIDGVGGVLGFVPLILFMFFGIAFLEDSGYLARVAFMLDRIFQIFGLHGSSGNGLYCLRRHCRWLCSARSHGYPHPALAQRAHRHAADGTVHELRGQIACLCVAHCGVFSSPPGAHDVHSHADLLERGPAGGQIFAHDRCPGGRPLPLSWSCHRIACPHSGGS